MVSNIKKNSVSNYPTPAVNCSVLCFLKEEDKADEQKAVYWISFQIPLQECIGLSPEQIDDKIKAEGERLFNLPEYQTIFQAIELGVNIQAPATL